MKAPTYRNLRKMTLDDLICEHDKLINSTGGVAADVKYFLNEISRRQTEESTQKMDDMTRSVEDMTRKVVCMTKIIVVFTLATMVISGVSTWAALKSLSVL